MEITDAIMSRRTKRKYKNTKVSHELLVKLIEYARMAPSGANMQPLKFAVIDNPEKVQKVFGCTKWSGYVPDGAPKNSEQPPAYILMLGDKNIKANGQFETDAGASGTIILLAAEAMGLSCCWLGAIDRNELRRILDIDESLELLYLIAVGYSEQKSKAVDAHDDIKYFSDNNGDLYIPKRTIDEILINI